MFNDLVAELHHAVIADMYPWDAALYVRAADEIERLRTAGDELATRLRWWTDNTDPSYPDHEALRTWEQVTRG